MQLIILLPLFLLMLFIEDIPFTKKLTSKERLNTIKNLESKKDLSSNSKKWDLIRQEISYINQQIDNNKNFKLSKYFNKNSFMQKLINQQIIVDKEINRLLN